MRTRLTAAALVLAMLAISSPAYCWLIPTDRKVPPLAIKTHRVTVTVEGQIAKTVVTQVYLNSTNRRLEATYVFPLPEHAAVGDFSMWVGGKEVKGELLEKEKAARIYQDIVRRIKDPALLEHIGGNIFRVKIFPIEPRSEQKIQLSYTERVSYDSGLCRYVYPLRMGEKASTLLNDLTFAMIIKSPVPIKTVYSPTHKMDVNRKDDHHVVVGFEESRARLDKDFEVYYTLSKKDLGINLLAHRTAKGDGYFMLMVTPREDVDDKDVVPVDTTFVIDTSGSMRGEKMKQAKEALKFCVRAVRKHDRFNIVRFSTEAEGFRSSPVEASEKNVEAAVEFIENMEARGGTAIDEALTTALSQKREGERPHMVLFLTDGLPTVGETNIDAIIRNADKRRGAARVFAFGVGYDVNTRLLGTLAGGSKGSVEYVKPQEDIEVKVGLLQGKVASPVMTDVTLDLGKIPTYDVYPKPLPDLFAGSQLLVIGRYRGEGPTAVTVTGKVGGRTRKIVEETKYPKNAEGADFLPRLWAERKVGYLLDEIKNHGEKKELTEEVVRLAKEYGILTPYTSFLVVPEQVARTLPPRQRDIFTRRQAQARSGGRGGAGERREENDRLAADHAEPTAPPAGRPYRTKPGTTPAAEAPAPTELEKAEARKLYFDARKKEATVEHLAKEFARRARREGETGQAAVTAARAVNALKDAGPKGGMDRWYGVDEEAGGQAAGRADVRSIGAKTFVRVAGVWIEQGYDGKGEPVRVKLYSEAYFSLTKIIADARKILALGDEVIFRAGEKVIHVGPEGIETLAELMGAMK